MTLRALVAVLVVSVVLPAFAQGGTVLVPVFYNGRGANGTQWSTEVMIVNGTDAPIDGNGVQFLVHCLIPEGCPSNDVPPQRQAVIDAPTSLRGLLLNVPAGRTEFQATFGNDYSLYPLPIVRDADFRSEPFSLLYVLRGSRYRVTLRIYSPDPAPGQQVRIELRHPEHPFVDALHARVVTLAPGDAIHPAFAEIAVDEIETPSGHARITIVPLGIRAWAFATSVRNSNGEVRLSTPQ